MSLAEINTIKSDTSSLLTKQMINAVIHGTQKQISAALLHDIHAPNTYTNIKPPVNAMPANTDRTPRTEGSLQMNVITSGI